ncbi:MAG: deoxyguanosinetriphosphate triphosphohydrolase, partial [Halobacteria archaeon]|nr:deoxyguanosinetriphosphate triphosphohydrolase [Halobacteria archaeon]
HSSAFRRLEYKTQVFVNHEGDMFRTRLTHSIEVAQISRSIARILNLNEDLSETVALAHDLGHTPFGHAGQDALNACMQKYGGFEHNLQSLRTVDTLEERYAEFPGLNLTFESREGILKHCSLRNAEQLGEVGQRFIDKTQPSLEAQLVNLADQIAYNNHDVDDGLRSGLITIEQLLAIDLFAAQHAEVIARYPVLSGRRLIHEIIRRMINQQVIDLVETSQTHLNTLSPQSIDDIRAQRDPLIRFSSNMLTANQSLKRFLRENLYNHYRVHRMTSKAQRTLSALFDAFMHEPRLLKPEHQAKIKQLEAEDGDSGRARVVADYIAGMTDRYAITEHRRIFEPDART